MSILDHVFLGLETDAEGLLEIGHRFRGGLLGLLQLLVGLLGGLILGGAPAPSSRDGTCRGPIGSPFARVVIGDLADQRPGGGSLDCALRTGTLGGTGHLERIDLNDQDQEIAREWLLEEFKQRIRDVRQGPDGYLYVLTEAEDAALLRLSPVESP